MKLSERDRRMIVAAGAWERNFLRGDRPLSESRIPTEDRPEPPAEVRTLFEAGLRGERVLDDEQRPDTELPAGIHARFAAAIRGDNWDRERALREHQQPESFPKPAPPLQGPMSLQAYLATLKTRESSSSPDRSAPRAHRSEVILSEAERTEIINRINPPLPEGIHAAFARAIRG